MHPGPVTFTSLDFGGSGFEPAPAPASDYTPPELTRRVAESVQSMTPWGWPLFWQAFQDSTIPGPGGFAYRGATGTTTDRQYGRDLPFFWSEVELRGYRVMSRYLCETNLHAIGFLELLTDYHIGTGYGWQACLKGQTKSAYPTTVGKASDPLVVKAQAILDEFRDFNHWPEVSAEAFTRWRRDGEVFGRTTCAGGNSPICYRVIEPEQVGTPDGATNEPWSYGIDVVEYPDGSIDSQTPIAYHVWDLESGMTRGEWLDACEVVHVKANVDSTVKRGRPDFFPLSEELDGVRRLLRNMLVTAVDQAAIAWLEQFPTASLDQVRGLVPEQVTTPGTAVPVNAYPGVMNPFGGGPWQGNGNKFRPGTIIRTEGGRQFAAGPTSTGTQSFVAVEQAVLRAVGSRWRFPEYFSGDASNNNMASSIVAGGPFVQGVKRSQNTWGARFERKTALRVLDLAVESGRLTKAERARLDVEVTPPAVVAPKPNEDAQRIVSLTQGENPIMSIPTAQQQLGLDPQHEAENIESAKAKKQQQGQQGPPGQPPATPPDQGGGLGGLFESILREGFTGTDSHGHHWVDGKQVKAKPDAGSGVKSPKSQPGVSGQPRFESLLESGPPHAGLVFDTGSHRWKNPHTGEEHERHPHAASLTPKATAHPPLRAVATTLGTLAESLARTGPGSRKSRAAELKSGKKEFRERVKSALAPAVEQATAALAASRMSPERAKKVADRIASTIAAGVTDSLIDDSLDALRLGDDDTPVSVKPPPLSDMILLVHKGLEDVQSVRDEDGVNHQLVSAIETAFLGGPVSHEHRVLAFGDLSQIANVNQYMRHQREYDEPIRTAGKVESEDRRDSAVLAESGFTGTDSHGHHWVDGKQVAAQPASEPAPTAKPKPAKAKSHAHAIYLAASPKVKDALDAAFWNVAGAGTTPEKAHKHKDKRDLANQLGSAYDHMNDDGKATPEDFAAMDAAIKALIPGAEKIHEPGEEATFDGSKMLAPDGGVFTGDRVKVVKSGWAMVEGDKPFVALKATVAKA